ncbi:MAG TPA: hypothetical protein DHV36_07115 [Desulfobacteraceae bacterium]|nr:hypothetical protein [Desulfobacteraceae bacterium]
MMREPSEPNWLLRILICVSLLVHIVVVLRMAGMYQKNAVSYIELSILEFSEPNQRVIPVPRVRHHPKNSIADVKAVKPNLFKVPVIKMDVVEAEGVDQSYEKIPLPDLPEDEIFGDLTVADIPAQSGKADIAPVQEEMVYESAEAYFELLNLRIHTAKQYPESARLRHLEGRTVIQFILLTDGRVTDVRVVKSSFRKDLDDAAVAAVIDATPFPRLPSFISKVPISLKVDILFELNG